MAALPGTLTVYTSLAIAGTILLVGLGLLAGAPDGHAPNAAPPAVVAGR